MTHEREISFFYRNHRGEVEERHVIPIHLEFDLMPHPEHHQQPGWVLTCYDLDRAAARSFLLSNICLPNKLTSISVFAREIYEPLKLILGAWPKEGEIL